MFNELHLVVKKKLVCFILFNYQILFHIQALLKLLLGTVSVPQVC